jgi:branched-chain amino acid transport system substrate-binding protein
VLDKLGYGLHVTDPGRYQNLTDDFSAQINAFKQGNVEIVTGVPIPPDFTTFWNQAKQQGFTPKAASIGKAILFPQAVEALGDSGHNLSSEVWWSPSHPFKSSLNGLSAGRGRGRLYAGDGQGSGPSRSALSTPCSSWRQM